jgi:hypothetical protein
LWWLLASHFSFFNGPQDILHLKPSALPKVASLGLEGKNGFRAFAVELDSFLEIGGQGQEGLMGFLKGPEERGTV